MEIPDYEPFYLVALDNLRAEIARLGLNIPIEENPALLAAPLDIGGKRAPNRFCAQPIAGRDANPDGSPGPLTCRRYRRYAEGGFGLIWIESTAAGAGGDPAGLRLHEGTVDAFKAWVDTLRQAALARWCHDVVLILQLTSATPYPARVHVVPGDAAPAPLLSDSEIDRHRAAIIQAATLAAQAGFDGVDIQSCHGALAGALLGAFTRTGPYGGPFENRTRFLRESVSGIRAQSPDLLLATRLRAYDALRHPHGFGVDQSDYRKSDLAEPARLVRLLRESGLALLNVTAASPNLRGPADERPFGPKTDADAPDEHPLMVLDRQLRLARALREAAPGIPVVGSGFSWLRHFLPEVASGALRDNAIDFAGMGRGALACPDAPARVLSERRIAAGSCCMVCFACSLLHDDGGPVGCVIRDSETYGPVYQRARRFAPDRLDQEARRCHRCEAAPCVAACPTRIDIPGFIQAFLEGDESKAYEIIRRRDPLPELTSQLSPGWMYGEGACIETALTGKPVPILDLQYTISWRARARGQAGLRLPGTSTGKRLAVVGGGPAGIAAAMRLLELGHTVGLFEHAETLGGTPERVIPSRRFSGAAAEINAILNPALKAERLLLHFGTTLSGDLSLDALRADWDAVLLATGLWQERALQRTKGAIDALAFLEGAKQKTITSVPERVAVLSGGDCAMDAATTAKALGANELFIVYGGPRSAMHWHMPEEWFATPGVHAMMLCQPLGYAVDDSGRLSGVRIRHAGLNQESVLPVGLVVEAMGLGVDDAVRAALCGLSLAEDGRVPTRDGSRTDLDRVYAAGALVNGGASVAQCVADGQRAAQDIHADLA